MLFIFKSDGIFWKMIVSDKMEMVVSDKKSYKKKETLKSQRVNEIRTSNT